MPSTAVENAPHWYTLITPAVVDSGLTWNVSEAHDAVSSLLGILLPLKYIPPSALLALMLVLSEPNPVRKRATKIPSPALIYE